MSRADLDLKVTAAIALLAIATAAADAPAAVRAVPAILLVLVLPGYVLSLALLPARRDPFERLLLSFGLSLCVAVLGGLILDRTGVGLTSRSWSVALAVFVIAAAVVAGHRRGKTGDKEPSSPGVAPPVRHRRDRRLGVAVVGVAAVALAVGALVIARQPSSSAHIVGSTSLWIKPQNPAAGTFSVGVRSDETRRTRYRLLVVVDETHRVLIRANVILTPGEQRTVRGAVPVPPGTLRTVRASLFRAGKPLVAYRQVYASFQRPGAP
jgi:uncharacterized membrane protein